MKKLIASASLIGLSVGIALATVPNDTYYEMSIGDITTLDPSQVYDGSSGRMTENIYNNLIDYKGHGATEFEPALATAWAIGNGGRTYTFTLRKNVKFHSGNTFSCADAEYTFERLIGINNATSAAWYTAEPLLGTGANAKDDKSVTWTKIDKAIECNAAGQLVFNLIKPDPAFFSKLASMSGAIIDKKHAIEIGEWDGTEKTWKDWVGRDLSDSNLSKKPSGTGAYMLVSRAANQTVFKAFNDYWGGKPKITNVILQLVPELATRLEAIKRGDVDRITAVGRTNLPQVQNAPGIKVIDGINPSIATALAMNQNIKDPAVLGSGKLDGKGIPANFFSDLNVRKAFSYAFNYDRFIKEALLGKGSRTTMLLPENYLGYDPKVKMYNYNPELAKAAFQKAWGGELWKNGFVLEAQYVASSVTDKLALEMMQESIQKINPKFKMTLRPIQFSESFKLGGQSKLSFYSLPWQADYGDPDNFLYTYLSSNGYYHPNSNFSDRVIDNLLEQARSTTDVAKRRAFYSQVGNRAYELAAFIIEPLPVGFIVQRDNLKGIEENYNGMLSGLFRWKDLSK